MLGNKRRHNRVEGDTFDLELTSASLLNRSLTKLLMKCGNMLWEYRLGIHSRGALHSAAGSDSVPYSTSSYRTIMGILHNLSLKSSDVFVDIGCGKGRVLCCASRFRIREVVGIEADESLCATAQRNAEKARGKKSPIRIINAAAQEFDYRAGTVYYLFHPFGAATLNQVLARIEQSLQLHPREIRIVYLNPAADFLLRKNNWLEMYERWQAGDKFGLTHDVSFWRGNRA